MITVVKIGGDIVANARLLDGVACDVARRVHGGVVVVHGAGPQLDAALDKANIRTTKVRGLRATPAAAVAVLLESVLEASGTVAQAFAARKLPTRALLDPPPLAVRPVGVVDGVDLGRVGAPFAVRTGPLTRALAAEEVPLVGPVGLFSGALYNVNADEVALAVALALDASELSFVSAVGAVLDGAQRAIPRLSASQAQAMLGSTATGGMELKLRTALAALEAGIPKVTISAPGALGTVLEGSR